ncbi:tetratricopeptide repeat protein [Variovorax davisae]|uniref:tetratricopeptide repeat protein n=1 Tax=Variovorax davisae TaxID=3053515 RepID=UPI0025788F15|nr:tetratricopeptide repeat protein [Variovorax sp. J22P271]
MLPHRRKVVLVVDLVESVTLMQADELGVVTRWQALLAEVNRSILPAHEGRLVKSLGDGLMTEFDAPQQAAAAALALHEWMETRCPPLPDGHALHLRAGMHATDVYVDQHDIYGHGVNLAARVATLAGPGQTVITAEVRDLLDDELDGVFEDLGECWLKHIDQPVRAYRLASPAGRHAPIALHDSAATPPVMQATIAVLPFSFQDGSSQMDVIGDLIADGIIAQISKSDQLRVVSRLSTRALGQRNLSLGDIAGRLAANYVLSGSYYAPGRQILMNAELAHAASGRVIWASRRIAALEDLFNVRCETIDEFASEINAAILSSELALVSTAPIPNLSSYTLMLGGISLMHRSARTDFARSREVLELLVERHAQHPLARAWLAKWYVLCATRGLSTSPADDASRALDQTRRALDNDPANALALAMEGFVYCHLIKDFDKAALRLDEAVTHNPNEPLAWLFKGMTHAFEAQGPQAQAASARARALSPLDPLAYYYESLSASMAIANGDYEEAIRLAQRSLQRNAIHPSTYRALAIAQALSHRIEDARATVERLMRLDPAYSLTRFKKNYPAAERAPEQFRLLVEALREAGVKD